MSIWSVYRNSYQYYSLNSYAAFQYKFRLKIVLKLGLLLDNCVQVPLKPGEGFSRIAWTLTLFFQRAITHMDCRDGTHNKVMRHGPVHCIVYSGTVSGV